MYPEKIEVLNFPASLFLRFYGGFPMHFSNAVLILGEIVDEFTAEHRG